MFIKWIIIIMATLNFGYMVFDGGRALATGDYIRPKSGTHAGQLGPWAPAVEKVGINPESTTMKVIFVVWGLDWPLHYTWFHTRQAMGLESNACRKYSFALVCYGWYFQQHDTDSIACNIKIATISTCI